MSPAPDDTRHDREVVDQFTKQVDTFVTAPTRLTGKEWPTEMSMGKMTSVCP